MIHVKAAKHTSADDLIFSAEGAGIKENGTPTQALVYGDGKSVAVEGRHQAVKQALREGVLVEVEPKTKARAKPEDKAEL